MLVQHKQVAADAEHVLSPHAFLDFASYASEVFHIPEGMMGVHTAQLQEQQILQQG
jgi:hypothetical protein